ncbi:hypothetical protein DACRYDRAFT_18688 [Dacryopinax primogenitus]|uniref:Oxidase ustYa n=1 Tax=Dacryopinax primogenitus (strain DJM 731) TaxID=1858805 RepID=M5FPR9_DACPD|nr:uncharacterized protein DACRYDRAFT_18688 [Dacryopinax primogenitus]EJT97268.1 hypothetical protein DACRYDRAFT_18688 [Dacryopinax primogenitus]
MPPRKLIFSPSTFLPKSSGTKLRGISLALVAALVLALVLNIGALFMHVKILSRGSKEYTYLEGDRPRELPIKVRTVNMGFHDDPEHYAMAGIPAWAEWNAIRPHGKGFAFLGEEYFAFGVSMWHQMHCLNHIRAALVNGDDGSDHTEHCFHYLRQGILCAADTTLEPGGTGMLIENGDKVATGGGVVHTCRDWRQVHDWMEEKHAGWTEEQQVRINVPSGHAGHGEGQEKNEHEDHEGHGSY